MPVPAKRTAKAEQTRSGIVDAAMTLFRAGGYDATTMRAIGLMPCSRSRRRRASVSRARSCPLAPIWIAVGTLER